MKECPKCGYMDNDRSSECPKCGIVYEKIYQYEAKRKQQERFSNNSKKGKLKKPSKNHLIIAFLAMLAITTVTILLTVSMENKEDIGGGFRSVKWGTDIENVKDMIPEEMPSEFDEFGDLKDEEQFHNEKVSFLIEKFVWGDSYTKKHDLLKLGKIDLDTIEYKSFSGFYSAHLTFSCDKYDEVVTYCKKSYGNLSPADGNVDLKKQIGNVKITLGKNDKKNPCVGFLCYTYLPILENKEKIDAEVVAEKTDYKLQLLDWRWRKESGHVIAVGQVKNISNQKLKNVLSVVSWFNSESELITSDSTLLEYNPIMPRQTSPFKVISNYNPEMQKASINFKFFSGEIIPFKK